MVEARDKNGPPALQIDVRCGHLDCGYVGVIEGDRANVIAARLYSPRWKGSHPGHLHIRQLIARMVCPKCRRRFASLTFGLVYRAGRIGDRQHHDRNQWLPDMDM